VIDIPIPTESHPDEPRDIRIKRLKMRSMRRGIKEMDLILEHFSTQQLASMSDAELDDYESLLSENDHDLYQWVSGQSAAPSHLRALIKDIGQVFKN
jgi:antitoxin CptB